MKKPQVVGTGLICLDVIVTKGRLDDPILQAGGSCGNVLSNLSYLGWDTETIARIGRDPSGEVVKNDLLNSGVGLDGLIENKGDKTPVILQVNYSPGTTAAKHVFRWRCPECDSYFPRFKPPTIKDAMNKRELMDHPKVFYFDRIFPSALRLAEVYKNEGATVVFEPNSIRDEKLFKKAVDLCDILKYNHDKMANHSDLLDNVKAQIQIETLGIEGLRYKVGANKWKQLNAISAPFFVDSSGSGDWCTTGLIQKLLEIGKNPPREPAIKTGLREGQALAAINCAYPGARGVTKVISGNYLKKLVADILSKNKKKVQFGIDEICRLPNEAAVCNDCNWGDHISMKKNDGYHQKTLVRK